MGLMGLMRQIETLTGRLGQLPTARLGRALFESNEGGLKPRDGFFERVVGLLGVRRVAFLADRFQSLRRLTSGAGAEDAD